MLSLYQKKIQQPDTMLTQATHYQETLALIIGWVVFPMWEQVSLSMDALVKSLNQWYNKRVATLKEGKPQGYWEEQLARITEKRNRQMRDAVNKAAKLVVDHCIKLNIRLVQWFLAGIKDKDKKQHLGKRLNLLFKSPLGNSSKELSNCASIMALSLLKQRNPIPAKLVS